MTTKDSNIHYKMFGLLEIIENIILSVLFKNKIRPDIHVFHKISSEYTMAYLYDFKWFGGILRYGTNTNTNFVDLHKLLKNVYNNNNFHYIY